MIILTNTEKSFHRIQPLILIKLFKKPKLTNISFTFIYICGGLVTKSCPTLVTSWTVVCQAPLSMGFSREEYSGGCHFLLQGSFQTQGLNPSLLHCRQILQHLNHQGSHDTLLLHTHTHTHTHTHIYIYTKIYICIYTVLYTNI